jgi:hypothetical protein
VDLIAILLPIVRRAAEQLAGSDLGADAQADVRTLESFLSRHEAAIAASAEQRTAEAAEWLESRLRRYLPPQAQPADLPA